MNTKKRSAAADIIRCLAFFFVVSVHFFLKNGFYQEPVQGKRMFILTLMRSLFIICVPLFLTLSGYLLRKKEPSKKYYTRITKILMTYGLSSLACIAYAMVFLHEKYTVKNVITKLLNFNGAPYAWYIEMYLGLFLIIPFLNILYNHIRSQKWKIGLILTSVFLTSLPSVVNVYNFGSISWWALPSSLNETYKLIPSWWTGMYPITYYFIGCYLSEYGLAIKKRWNFLLIVLCTLVSGVYAYWRSYKAHFIWGSWCGYESLFNVILTTLVFTFLINIDYAHFPERLSRFIQKVSALCLGGYLVSWIFDSVFYPILIKNVPSVPHRLEYYIVIVPLVFTLSLALSYLVSKLQWLLEILYAQCRKRMKRPK